MNRCLFKLFLIFFFAISSVTYCEAYKITPSKGYYKPGEKIRLVSDKKEVYPRSSLIVSHDHGVWEQQFDFFDDSVEYIIPEEGLYAIQVNHYDAENNVIKMDYVGQIQVNETGEPPKYIHRITWYPQKNTLRKGEKFELAISPYPNIHLPAFEMRVIIKQENESKWEEVTDWHPWPLPEIDISDYKMPASVQVLVRPIGGHTSPQVLWLGQFFEESSDYKPCNLINAILAHHRNPKEKYSTLETSVSEELQIAIYLLIEQYKPHSLKNKMAYLKSIGASQLSETEALFRTTDHTSLKISLDKNTISDGILTLDLSLDLFPEIEQIISQVCVLPKNTLHALLATFLLYDHFIVGQSPAFPIHRPGLRTVYSECYLSNKMLENFLKFFNYDVSLLNLRFSKDKSDNNIISGHYMIELKDGKRYYLLDALTGRISYPYNKSIIIHKKLPQFITFPQSWNAESVFDVFLRDVYPCIQQDNVIPAPKL